MLGCRVTKLSFKGTCLVCFTGATYTTARYLIKQWNCRNSKNALHRMFGKIRKCEQDGIKLFFAH